MSSETEMTENRIYAGAGLGRIFLPDGYFPEDGFYGPVHCIQGEKGLIKDDPMARILLLEGGRRIAIVALEIAQTPADLVLAVKTLVGEICGVAADDIWVHTTHQFGFMHRPKDAVKSEMFNAAVKAAVKQAAASAAASFRPAKMGVGKGTCDVSANKNILPPEGVSGGPYYGPGSDGETNKVLTVLRFEDAADGEPIGFFLSYGTKPSALCITGKDDGNRELNSEVTGQACKWMEEHFGVPCVFCMPGAGDQYPRETAQFYGFGGDGEWNLIDIGFDAGIKIVDRLAAEMGAAAISVADSICCDKSEAQAAVTWTEFKYPNKAGDGEIEVPLDAIAFGDVAFFGFKQEMDVRTELEIWEASPYETTLLVSFLNGDGKYLSHDAAYDFNNGIGTWEANRSPFARGAAEKLVEIADGLLKDLKAGITHTEPRVELTAARTGSASAANSVIDFAGRKWIVLTKQTGRMLIMSREVVAKRAFNDTNTDTCWADCTLRKWLNGEFLDGFTDAELVRIVEVKNTNLSNPKYGISAGEDTIDKVFPLSISEAESFLGGFEELVIAKDDAGEPCWWYLRTPGEAANVAATVNADGHIDYHGVADSVADQAGGIRPCMWVRI